MIIKTFRSRLLLSSVILAAALLLGFFAVQVTSNTLPVEEAFNVESLIRLHVLANSDSPGDQDLKLKVWMPFYRDRASSCWNYHQS